MSETSGGDPKLISRRSFLKGLAGAGLAAAGYVAARETGLLPTSNQPQAAEAPTTTPTAETPVETTEHLLSVEKALEITKLVNDYATNELGMAGAESYTTYNAEPTGKTFGLYASKKDTLELPEGFPNKNNDFAGTKLGYEVYSTQQEVDQRIQELKGQFGETASYFVYETDMTSNSNQLTPDLLDQEPEALAYRTLQRRYIEHRISSNKFIDQEELQLAEALGLETSVVLADKNPASLSKEQAIRLQKTINNAASFLSLRIIELEQGNLTFDQLTQYQKEYDALVENIPSSQRQRFNHPLDLAFLMHMKRYYIYQATLEEIAANKDDLKGLVAQHNDREPPHEIPPYNPWTPIDPEKVKQYQ